MREKCPFGNMAIPALHKGDSMKTIRREQRQFTQTCTHHTRRFTPPSLEGLGRSQAWEPPQAFQPCLILSANISPTTWEVCPSSERRFIPTRSTLIPLPSAQIPPVLQSPIQNLNQTAPGRDPFTKTITLGPPCCMTFP